MSNTPFLSCRCVFEGELIFNDRFKIITLKKIPVDEDSTQICSNAILN